MGKKLIKKKIIGDSIFLSIAEILVRLKGLIFLPIILPILGMDKYGVFVQILVNKTLIVSIFSLSLGFGFYRFTSKYDDLAKGKIATDFWSIFFFSLLLSFVGAILLFLTSSIISNKILNGLELRSIKISSLLVVSGILWEVLSKFIQARRKFKLYSFFNLVYRFFPFFGFVVSLIFTKKIVEGICVFVLLEVITIFALFFLIIKNIQRISVSVSRIFLFLKYSWALVFTNFTDNILSKFDRYFIGYFIGPGAIGGYNIIYAVGSLLDVFTVPIRKYLEVYTPRLWDKGKDVIVKGKIILGLNYFLIPSLFALIVIVYHFEIAVHIFLNKELLLGQNIKLIVATTCIGILFLGISRIYAQLIKLKKINHFRLLIQSIAAILNGILNYLLIPKIGLLGASTSTLICYFSVVLIYMFKFNLGFNIKFYIKLIKLFLVSIFSFFTLSIIDVSNIYTLFLSTFVGLIVYIVGVFITKSINFSDLSLNNECR